MGNVNSAASCRSVSFSFALSSFINYGPSVLTYCQYRQFNALWWFSGPLFPISTQIGNVNLIPLKQPWTSPIIHVPVRCVWEIWAPLRIMYAFMSYGYVRGEGQKECSKRANYCFPMFMTLFRFHNSTEHGGFECTFLIYQALYHAIWPFSRQPPHSHKSTHGRNEKMYHFKLSVR